MNNTLLSLDRSRPFAVMFGGAGAEHGISCISAGNIIKTARACGYSLMPVGISRSGEMFIYLGDDKKIADAACFDDAEHLIPTFPVRIGARRGFLADGDIISVASVLIALHGDYGEDGRVQGLLDCAGISYTGCGTVTGAVASDKAFTKAVAESLGIPTLPWVLLTERDTAAAKKRAEERLGYPMFIKPSGLGSSIGACAVSSAAEFGRAYEKAFALGGRVLAERALIGKSELECAYICASGKKLITPAGMIRTDGATYDYDTKYNSGSAKLTARAEIPYEIARRIERYTEELLDALSVRHLARVDYFLSDGGELYFNEINTFPGMTDSSLYSSMLEASGISRSDQIAALIEAPLREGSKW